MATFLSTLTSKGQTTVPIEVRRALGLQPGERLEYSLRGSEVVVRRHPGAAALAGVLRSNKGAGLSFAQIRARATAAARR